MYKLRNGARFMEVLLSQNIKANRKRLGLTQEQLAEAMDVSVGTVSKWESGNSSPDIEMIVELADFFQQSVDVLLGYEWKHRSSGQTVEHLKTLRNEHRYEEGIAEAKKALQKFPNQIEVLYECGELLYVSSVVQTNLVMYEKREESTKNLMLAIEVFQKVVQLLEQNDNSAISRIKIHQEIGTIYGIIGQKEKAISYLKKYNVSNLNDWMISNFLTDLKQYDKAWDTVTGVFQHSVFEIFQCYQVMYSVLINTGKYDDLLCFALWMEQFCSSVQDGRISYYIRAKAITEAMIATAYAYKSVAEQKDYAPDISRYLQIAIENAKAFDDAPDYSGKTCFTSHVSETVYDGHGESAILTVQDVILCSKEDEEEFSVLRGIYDNIVSRIGRDEWRIYENNEKSEKQLL